MARYEVATADVPKVRTNLSAFVCYMRASRVEGASCRGVGRTGYISLQDDTLPYRIRIGRRYC